MHPDGKEDKVVMEQTADDGDQAKRCRSPELCSSDSGASFIPARNQPRENLRKWLSPPDSSTNHNIACGTHLKGTAMWFIEGSIFREWVSTGSLLWIHGIRTLPNFYHLTPDGPPSLSASWLWKECSMVRRILNFLSKVTDTIRQLCNHPRH